MNAGKIKEGCLLIAGILFLLLFFSFRGIEKTKLLDTEGRIFEKAEVTQVVSKNIASSGSGKQTVQLKFVAIVVVVGRKKEFFQFLDCFLQCFVFSLSSFQ